MKSRSSIKWQNAINRLSTKLDIQRYSPNTKRIYLTQFRYFANYFRLDDPKQITKAQVIQWINFLVKEKRASISFQNQTINAIKFYFEKVLGREKDLYDLGRPRKSQKLPTVLTRREVQSILNRVGNLKHRCIVELLYSSGLRLDELLNLKSAILILKTC